MAENVQGKLILKADREQKSCTLLNGLSLKKCILLVGFRGKVLATKTKVHWKYTGIVLDGLESYPELSMNDHLGEEESIFSCNV